MKRIGYTILACCATLAFAATAIAQTPVVNSAIIKTRIYNDCPVSNLTTTNLYPGSIQIADDDPFGCSGFANLHVWRYSGDGTTAAQFPNNSNWRICSDFSLSGRGEGGLQMAPWFSQDSDGLFNVRSTDGEVACFGGRLPFYSFTGAQGLVYVAGTTIHLEMIYKANGLSSAAPATIEYIAVYNSITYSSGALPFDEGNTSEDPPHGLWGGLNNSAVGGHVKMFVFPGGEPHNATANWSNICFQNYDQATPAKSSSWGQVKSIYR
ncbi:MAG: hypothetical protein ABIU54_01915 [Candidatus Eisenbacteria bacterium]